jgi:hypothetical protein
MRNTRRRPDRGLRGWSVTRRFTRRAHHHSRTRASTDRVRTSATTPQFLLPVCAPSRRTHAPCEFVARAVPVATESPVSRESRRAVVRVVVFPSAARVPAVAPPWRTGPADSGFLAFGQSAPAELARPLRIARPSRRRERARSSVRARLDSSSREGTQTRNTTEDTLMQTETLRLRTLTIQCTVKRSGDRVPALRSGQSYSFVKTGGWL